MTEIQFAKIFPEYSQYFEILNRLVGLVQDEASKFNLTAIRDHEGIWNKHIIDSLMPTQSQLLSEFKPRTALDVGSGAGFPGLPLAIVMPETQFTLVDSTKKKVDAVNRFIENLGLTNATSVWQRLSSEDSHSKFAKYDLIVARAVMYLPDLINLCSRFLNDDGMMVFYKSVDPEETDAGILTAEHLGYSMSGKYDYKLPSVESAENLDARNILFFRRKAKSQLNV